MERSTTEPSSGQTLGSSATGVGKSSQHRTCQPTASNRSGESTSGRPFRNQAGSGDLGCAAGLLARLESTSFRAHRVVVVLGQRNMPSVRGQSPFSFTDEVLPRWPFQIRCESASADNKVRLGSESGSPPTLISPLGSLRKSGVAGSMGSVLRTLLGLGQLPSSLRCRGCSDVHRLRA